MAAHYFSWVAIDACSHTTIYVYVYIYVYVHSCGLPGLRKAGLSLESWCLGGSETVGGPERCNRANHGYGCPTRYQRPKRTIRFGLHVERYVHPEHGPKYGPTICNIDGSSYALHPLPRQMEPTTKQVLEPKMLGSPTPLSPKRGCIP